jgi:hypothetical protein
MLNERKAVQRLPLRKRLPAVTCIAALALLLYLLPPRRASAEDYLDLKTMYYREEDDRIEVWAPTFLYQTEVSPTLSIRIDGIYNSISGATPTGAPPAPVSASPAQTLQAPVNAQP